MSNEERLEMAILHNDFLLRYRCEGAVDAEEFADLCEHLRALARQWSHQDTVSKSLAGLLCEEAIIIRNFDCQLGANAAREDFRNMLIEVETLILVCFYRAQDTENLPLPFADEIL